jgi:tyrosyl-tRNA synthetase
LQAQVNVKIKQAFCPPKIVEGNPCLEYIKYIVFPWFGKFEVIRKESNGGNKTFLTMDELISEYESGALHPADVKPALAKAINEILQPVRDHFNNNSEAKVLLNTVKKYRVTN